MAFMGLIGYDKVPVRSVSEANFSTTPVEISMVLDVTGSMNDFGKLGSLKLAATNAIDILLPATDLNSKVRIGLVPYSAGVNLKGNLASLASGQNNYTCMTERTNNPYSDVSYASEPVGADRRARCSNSLVRPLTANSKILKQDIRNLVAEGATAGHLGIAWGYYMLSEKWQKLWEKESAAPSDYDGKTKKIAILMTDGSFNTYFKGVPNTQSPFGGKEAESANDSKGLCTDMKKQKNGNPGIIVYSIAFKAPNNAKQILQNCATPDDTKTTYYYDADNEAQLIAAFREIATSIKSLRLTR
jgi:hypothetical protein